MITRASKKKGTRKRAIADFDNLQAVKRKEKSEKVRANMFASMRTSNVERPKIKKTPAA